MHETLASRSSRMSALRALGAELVSAFERTKFLFRWKLLECLLKQPITAMSSSVIMVLIKLFFFIALCGGS